MSDVEVLLVPVATDSPARTPEGVADDFHWRSQSKESPKFSPQWQAGAPAPPTLDDRFPSEPTSPTSPYSPEVRGTRIQPGSACTSDWGSNASYGSRALSPLRFDPLSPADLPTRQSTTLMLPVLLDAESNTDTMVGTERSNPSSCCTGSMTAASSSALSAAWNYNKIVNLDMLDAGSGNATPMIFSGTSTPCGVATAVVKSASRPGTAKRWQENPVTDASRTATSSTAKVEMRSKLRKLRDDRGSDDGSGTASVVVDMGGYENYLPPDSNTDVVGSVSGITSQGSAASRAKARDHQMDATMPGQPMDLAKPLPPPSAPRASPESVGGASSLMSEQVAASLFQKEIIGRVESKDTDESNLGTTLGTTAFDGVDSSGMQTGQTWFEASKFEVSGLPYLPITEEDFPDTHPIESVRTAGSFEEHVLAQFSEDLVPSECFSEKSEAGLESVRTEATYEERVLDALLMDVEDGIAKSVAADDVAEDLAVQAADGEVDEEVVSVQSLQWPESVRTAASTEERIVAALDDEFADLENFDLSTPGQIDSVRTAASLEERILASLDLDVEVESRPPSQGYAGSVATAASLEERIVDTLDFGIDFGDSRPPSSSIRSVGTDATLEERIVASFDLLGSDEIDIALALRVVGTYVLKWGDDGRFKSRGEITQVEGSKFRWQDQDGQKWVLDATADPTIFDVGSDCPYCKEGFNQMHVGFDEVGNVEYVTGPTFPEGPHWEKKAYDAPIAGRYVPETDEESEDVVVIESLGDNKFRWIHADLKRWVVTATVDPSAYNVSPGCPYYHTGYKQMRVDFDKEGDIECLHGPRGGRWKKPSEPKIVADDRPVSEAEEPLAEPEIELPVDEPAAEPAAEEKPRRKSEKLKEPTTPEPEPVEEWRRKPRPKPKKLQEADSEPATPERKPSIPHQDLRWQVKPSPKRRPRIRHELGPDDLAEINARRAVRLAYHRSIAPSPVYQPYRRTAMAEDLAANDHSPSTWTTSPEVMLKNRNTQRKAYMSLPPGAGRYLRSRRKTGKDLALMEPIAELATSGEMDLARTSGGKKLPHVQSAPLLGTLGSAGKASLGTNAYSTTSSKSAMSAGSEKTRKLLKKYNAPDGLEMLRLLKEGRLPSILCPPI